MPPFAGRTHAGRPDAGGIVVGWLLKIVLVGAAVGLVGFDALSVATVRLGVVDQGEMAARTGSDRWNDSKDIQLAYDAAASAAELANPNNSIDADTFRVDRNGTVHLRISRDATTLVLHRVGRLRSWTLVSEEVAAKAAV